MATASKEELRAHYKTVQGTLKEERAMRALVFKDNAPKRATKINEIDRALAALAELGAALAVQLEEEEKKEAGYERATLFELPQPKGGY